MIIFNCDAVRAGGLVRSDTECCRSCHADNGNSRDVPFIVVGLEQVTVCCAVASAYNDQKSVRAVRDVVQ